MTLVVNLYGGPGTGKSTSSAYVFAKLKMAGVNAEQVHEAAKEWARRGEPITEAIQHVILNEQISREIFLLPKVEVLVTDAPLLIAAYFAQKFYSEGTAETCLQLAHSQRNRPGRNDLDVWLIRSKPYSPEGRYQTESEARAIDPDQRQFVASNVRGLTRYNTTCEDLDVLVDQVLRLVRP